MKKLFLIVLMAFAGVSAWADEVRTAKIQCNGQQPDDVYYVQAELQFPGGYVNYGPSRNTFEGQMNFAFGDGTDNSVVYSKVQGSQIMPSRFEEPEFWSFVAFSGEGELIQMNLQSDRLRKGLYSGSIERQNGRSYSARCQIQISELVRRGPRYPRYPR